MASYFPPSTDPNYAAYDVAYPSYRENLEARYPQVCAKCEPKVQERLRSTAYVAQTDHLRRLMDQTRGATPGRSWRDCGWRGAAVFMGGIAWWASLLGQVLWDAFSIMAAMTDLQPAELFLDYPYLRHLQHYIQLMLADEHGQRGIDVIIEAALGLGWASSWWNTRLMGKLRRSGLRLTGLNEYYKLQVLVLAVRTAAWWVLRENSNIPLLVAQKRGAHAFMLSFTALVSSTWGVKEV